jgi:hypothetical protein
MSIYCLATFAFARPPPPLLPPTPTPSPVPPGMSTAARARLMGPTACARNVRAPATPPPPTPSPRGAARYGDGETRAGLRGARQRSNRALPCPSRALHALHLTPWCGAAATLWWHGPCTLTHTLSHTHAHAHTHSHTHTLTHHPPSRSSAHAFVPLSPVSAAPVAVARWWVTTRWLP